MPKIECVREGRTLEVPEGANLREALMKEGIDPYRAIDGVKNCRGHGLCGTCVVEVDPPEALGDPTFRERTAHLWQFGARPIRLSCQAKVGGDCRVLTQPQLTQGWYAHPFYAHLKEGVKEGAAKEPFLR
jgi:ferredoxin